MLTKEAFSRARDFIERHARPLDIARFRFHFENGGREDVWQRLKQFQNADGGFGRALEPDIRAPESTALATTIALQIVREVSADAAAEGAAGGPQPVGSAGDAAAEGPMTDAGFPANAPTGSLGEMLRDAINYLMKTYDEHIGGWRIVPASVERSPHAPWWRQSGREDVFDRFSLNPNAELLGHLLDYRQFVPTDILTGVSEKVLQSIEATAERHAPLEMHELLCCKRLAESPALDESTRGFIVDTLSAQLAGAVGSPQDWSGYSLRPLQVAESPHSPFFGPLQHLIADNLAHEIANQQPDGSWAPTWSWGDDHDYPRVWEAAKFEWSGALTVDTLVTLKGYGKIAPID